MNDKNVVKLLIFGQGFLLFSVLLMPILVRWLNLPLGKVVYSVLCILSVAQGVALNHVLRRLD